MRKLFFTIMLLLGTVSAFDAFSQAPKMILRLGVGGANSLRNDGLYPDNPGTLSLAGIYGPQYQDAEYLPVSNFGFDYRLGRRLELSLDFDWTMSSATALDGVTRNFLSAVDFLSGSIMPGLRVIWQGSESKSSAFYSAVSAGVNALLSTDVEGRTATKIRPGYQVVPFGLRAQLSEKVPVILYGELSFGTSVNGVRIGVGYGF